MTGDVLLIRSIPACLGLVRCQVLYKKVLKFRCIEMIFLETLLTVNTKSFFFFGVHLLSSFGAQKG